jgi:hypothetical protein
MKISMYPQKKRCVDCRHICIHSLLFCRNQPTFSPGSFMNVSLTFHTDLNRKSQKVSPKVEYVSSWKFMWIRGFSVFLWNYNQNRCVETYEAFQGRVQVRKIKLAEPNRSINLRTKGAIFLGYQHTLENLDYNLTFVTAYLSSFVNNKKMIQVYLCSMHHFPFVKSFLLKLYLLM